MGEGAQSLTLLLALWGPLGIAFVLFFAVGSFRLYRLFRPLRLSEDAFEALAAEAAARAVRPVSELCDSDWVRWSEGSLPEDVTSKASRRDLIAYGLPPPPQGAGVRRGPEHAFMLGGLYAFDCTDDQAMVLTADGQVRLAVLMGESGAEQGLQFVNSSPAQYARSQVLVDWALGSRARMNASQWDAFTDTLRQALETIDPVAMKDPEHFWPRALDGRA